MNKSLICALLALAPAAFAQSAELGMHAGAIRLREAGLGVISSGSVNTPNIPLSLKDNSWRFGFRLTLNSGRFTGHEAFYAYNRTALEYGGSQPQSQGMAIHQGGYNYLLYLTPEGLPVRPFVTGGGHFSNFVPPGASATSGGGSTKFGVNYGAGVKVKVAPSWMVRLDIRDYLQGKPFGLPGATGKLHLIEVSAGVSFIL